MAVGFYSNVMREAYWYTQCKPYFGWGYEPCKDKDCNESCVSMCERSYEFKMPGFLLHFHGCNLNCRFCWAYGVRKKKSIAKTPHGLIKDLLCKLWILSRDRFILKARVKPFEIGTIRITGNEPTLQWEHLLELLKIFDEQSEISKICRDLFDIEPAICQRLSNLLHNLKVLIQTNGVEIGRDDSPIDVMDLKKIRSLKLIFEVSFKGVNKEQFAWLADSDPKLFEYQCIGFEKLWKLKNGNISVIAELGINHCDKIKKYPDLGVRILNKDGKPLDFAEYDEVFKNRVLKYASLSQEANEFQEFGEINKDRSREVIEIYSKSTGQIKKRCLPSEFIRACPPS